MKKNKPDSSPRRSNPLKNILLAGLFATSLSTATVYATPPQLAVFRWSAPGGVSGVDAHGTWINRPEIWAEDFLDHVQWDNIAWPGWLADGWKPWLNARSGRKLLISLPMLPNTAGVTLAQGAAGSYNSYFKSCAQEIAARGIADKVIIRLGWEMNLGIYPWAAAKDKSSWPEFWRKIVTTMRAVPGCAGLKFCFNPNKGWEQIPPEQVYPGDAYVDYVALDLYDDCWSANTYPYPAGSSATEIQTRRTTAWNVYQYGDHGLEFWQNFCATHGKGFGLGEWGVDNRADGHGGLDNPYYIQKMYDYMNTHAMAFACYFDVNASDGAHQLSGTTQFPNAAAKYKALFSGGANGSLVNGGFEANGGTQTPSGWKTWSADGANDDDYTSGGTIHSGSWMLTHWKATAYQVTTYQTVTGLANASYKVSAWVKRSGSFTNSRMEVSNYGGGTVYVNIPNTTTWTLISTTVGVTNGQINIGFYSNAAGNNWLNLDDVSLTKL